MEEVTVCIGWDGKIVKTIGDNNSKNNRNPLNYFLSSLPSIFAISNSTVQNASTYFPMSCERTT